VYEPGPDDPIPLSPAQLAALLGAAARELTWGLRAVSREIRCWRASAEAIPDASIRRDALAALAAKRGHIDGAALFWILTRRRDVRLLQLLVAYNVLCDYLDSITEQPNHGASTDRLHRALTEALDPWGPMSDYFRDSAGPDDGGYLRGLVHACRAGCAALPSYRTVQPQAMREASRARTVLPLNHLRDPDRRDAALRRWARQEFPAERELAWFELTAAASTWLAVEAVLALAAEPTCDERDAAAACAAYFPWCSFAGTMLDSYVDCPEDLANGSHSYVSHYPSAEVATARVRESIRRSAEALRTLRNGHRHAVIFACMTAMYLSKDSARRPEARRATRTLAGGGGSLTLLLVPVLRVWRIAYAQRSS
jgi:tetraprenyl-beta-curcumene synthase